MDIVSWILVVGVGIFGLIGWMLYLIQKIMNDNIRYISPGSDVVGAINRLIAHLDDYYKVIDELADEIRAERDSREEK